jgi:two-component system cell cycle sensor histidine kinase/response regulator CckA
MLANMEPFRRSEKSTFFGSRQALGAIGDSVAMAAATQPSIEDIHQTILFVEDEKHQAMLMGGFLQKKGFRLLIACDGVEAVEIHRRHKDEIAAVIMDMSLPKLSGWEAFLSMKKIQPEITTIFATGYITPEERLKMINQGAVDIIQKPYLPDQLLQQIRTALSKRA